MGYWVTREHCFHVAILHPLKLAGSCFSYLRAVVNSVGSVPEICDSDGEIISFESGTMM